MQKSTLMILTVIGLILFGSMLTLAQNPYISPMQMSLIMIIIVLVILKNYGTLVNVSVLRPPKLFITAGCGYGRVMAQFHDQYNNRVRCLVAVPSNISVKSREIITENFDRVLDIMTGTKIVEIIDIPEKFITLDGTECDVPEGAIFYMVKLSGKGGGIVKREYPEQIEALNGVLNQISTIAEVSMLNALALANQNLTDIKKLSSYLADISDDIKKIIFVTRGGGMSAMPEALQEVGEKT